MSLRLGIAACLAIAILPTGVSSQESKAEALMAKTAAYVSQFVDQFSNVVAEETLVQETTIPRRKRTMRSDFLLVRYPGDTAWQAFRDVAEVDGKPVRDKEDRLTKLFLEPSSSALRRAADLQEAGARYNLLNIGTINNPLLVVAFLQDSYRERFRFNLAGLEKSLGPNVRTVQFQEWKIPSILKGNSNGRHPVARVGVDRGRHRPSEKNRAAHRRPVVANLDHHALQVRRGAGHQRAGRDDGLVS
jgi:hypothetical protein